MFARGLQKHGSQVSLISLLICCTHRLHLFNCVLVFDKITAECDIQSSEYMTIKSTNFIV